MGWLHPTGELSFVELLVLRRSSVPIGLSAALPVRLQPRVRKSWTQAAFEEIITCREAVAFVETTTARRRPQNHGIQTLRHTDT